MEKESFSIILRLSVICHSKTTNSKSKELFLQLKLQEKKSRNLDSKGWNNSHYGIYVCTYLNNTFPFIAVDKRRGGGRKLQTKVYKTKPYN